MSDVSVQIQNPQQTININNPSIVIEIADDSIEVEFSEGQPLEIQVQNPVIEINIGGPCDCGGATAWGDITGTLADQTDLQSALDGKSDTGHTHPLSDLTQSGAASNQVPKWNGSAWVPADEAGGGAGVTEITYADMATAIAGSTLTPGGWYLITDAAGTDLGFLTNAVNENTINVSGVGGYLNADFQVVGDYSGTPETFNAQLGIWRTGFEAVTINYLNLTGGTFAVGDTITGGNTGATAVIVTDDGASSMTAYMTSAGVAFDGSEVLDNGAGVTADQDGAALPPTIVQGDVVIWNLLHYQLTDATLLDGTDPATNTAAYTLLDKATYPETYVTAWDESEFDFANSWVQYRQDLFGTKYRYSKKIDDDLFGYGFTAISLYQFGNEQWTANTIEDAALDARNELGNVRYNTLLSGVYFQNNTLSAGANFQNNILNTGVVFDGNTIRSNASFGNNLLLAGAYFTGNTLFPSAYVTNNTFFTNAGLSDCTFAANANFFSGLLYNSASISNLILGENTTLANNILENGASLTGITAGANCSISRNKIGQGATLGGSTTMYDSSTLDGNVLGSGATLGTLTIGVTGGASCDFNLLDPDAAMTGITVESGGNASGNKLGASANVNTLTLGTSTAFNANVIAGDGTVIDITAGTGCSISRNNVGIGATLGNGMVIGNNVEINNNVIPASYRIGENVTVGNNGSIGSNIDTEIVETSLLAGASIRYCNGPSGIAICQLHTNAYIANFIGYLTEVIVEEDSYIENFYSSSGAIDTTTIQSTNHVYQCILENLYISGATIGQSYDFKSAKQGFSNFENQFDITGLTTLDCLAENNYVGIFNLTSSNATEAIDTITNPPTAFPFTLRPAAGLTLTVTGTAYAGIGAGQIALKNASYVLDGTKGEYIVLEIDPLGTGCLVEKQVVNGII